MKGANGDYIWHILRVSKFISSLHSLLLLLHVALYLAHLTYFNYKLSFFIITKEYISHNTTERTAEQLCCFRCIAMTNKTFPFHNVDNLPTISRSRYRSLGPSSFPKALSSAHIQRCQLNRVSSLLPASRTTCRIDSSGYTRCGKR